MSPMIEVPHNRPSVWVPRGLAAVLALGGCCWGLLLSPWVFRPDVTLLAVLVFGPGYAITLAYIARSISTPALAARRLIWVASILVQGTWLAWDAWSIIAKIVAGQTPHEMGVSLAWWIFATVASAVGLLTEDSQGAEA